jgi:hypothetical protein
MNDRERKRWYTALMAAFPVGFFLGWWARA